MNIRSWHVKVRTVTTIINFSMATQPLDGTMNKLKTIEVVSMDKRCDNCECNVKGFCSDKDGLNSCWAPPLELPKQMTGRGYSNQNV